MKRNLRGLLLGLFAVSVVCLMTVQIRSGNAFARQEKSFLWKVRSGPVTVYLLGSLHFLKKENYPLTLKIEEAFEEADTLVVEANINDKSKMDLEGLAERALYPPNDNLKTHLSTETYERTKEKAAKLGIPPEVMDRQRPWLLGLTIASMELVKLGFDPRYGVDRYFLGKSKQKRILELESFDSQVQLFSDLSDAEQELYLLYTMRDLKATHQEFDHLVKLWKSGDTAGMESFLMRYPKEDKRLEPAYERFFYERNRNMVSHIEFYLKTNGTYFVVVGAGHLIGEKGIVELLKKRGYRVEQL